MPKIISHNVPAGNKITVIIGDETGELQRIEKTVPKGKLLKVQAKEVYRIDAGNEVEILFAHTDTSLSS